MSGIIKLVEFDRIRTDGGTQQRVALNEAAVAEYRERYDAGEEPEKKPVVFFDGSDYWLGDGFHRYFANKARDAATMMCDVRGGTRRDAVLFSTAANANNAVQRSPADKRRAVETLLSDGEWATWSDRAISEHVRVSPTTVGDVRRAMAAAGASVHAGQVRTYERGGRQVQVDTTNIGKGKPAAAVAPPVEPATDGRPFDSLDRLVQSVHDDATARASDNVTSMRDVDAATEAPTPAAEQQPTPQQKAEAGLAEAYAFWAARVQEIVYELVQQDATGCRLLAVIGLEMGDVGQALSEFECDSAEAGRKIVFEQHADQISEAINCDGLNPGPLIRRLLGDNVEHLLAMFNGDDDPTPMTPLFVALAEGWGATVPPEPQLADSMPKPSAEKGQWVARMKACRTANEARSLFTKHQEAVADLMKSMGMTPVVGRITPTYCVGFSVVKAKEWRKVYSAAEKTAPDRAAELIDLVEQGREIHGKLWQDLYEAEQGVAGGDLEADPKVAPPSAQTVRSIPQKPAGQSMTWYQWADRTAGSCRTLGLDVDQILPTDFAVGLFNEGLKPKQAAKRYAEQQKPATPATADEPEGYETGRFNPFVRATDPGRYRDREIGPLLYAVGVGLGDEGRIVAALASYGLHTLGQVEDLYDTYDGWNGGRTALRKKCPALSNMDAEQLVQSVHRYFVGRHHWSPEEPRPAKPADDFDDGEQVFAAQEVDVSLKTVGQADAFDTILTASKPVAVIRSVPALGRRWAVLGTKMVRGRECWRLATLDASSRSDLAGGAAMAAADRGEFDGIAVVDKADGSKRRRICTSNNTPPNSPANVIYVRMDEQGATHA